MIHPVKLKKKKPCACSVMETSKIPNFAWELRQEISICTPLVDFSHRKKKNHGSLFLISIGYEILMF